MAILLNASTPLSLAEILGATMSSVIDAQAQSARATVEFIKEVGVLEATSPSAEERLRTLTFHYRKLDENQEEADFQVDIPLLGLVDIPMISVKKATFAFTYEVSTTKPSVKASSSQPALAVAEHNYLTPIVSPAVISGRVGKASSPEKGTEKASLDIKIELEKSTLPVGLERILDILEVAASERKKEAGEENPPA